MTGTPATHDNPARYDIAPHVRPVDWQLPQQDVVVGVRREFSPQRDPGPGSYVRWSRGEVARLREAVRLIGEPYDWVSVAIIVRTRTREQCRAKHRGM